MRILVEGRPGSGKSTVARRLADTLAGMGIPVSGFVTEEIRESGRRIGFSIERFGCERGVLAHVDLPGPPRVGRYGVDLSALERLAIPALREATDRDVVIIDELGKMELASQPFRDAVSAIFDRPVLVVATVHTEGTAGRVAEARSRERPLGAVDAPEFHERVDERVQGPHMSTHRLAHLPRHAWRYRPTTTAVTAAAGVPQSGPSDTGARAACRPTTPSSRDTTAAPVGSRRASVKIHG